MKYRFFLREYSLLEVLYSISFCVYRYSVCMCVYVPCVCLVPIEIRRGHQLS